MVVLSLIHHRQLLTGFASFHPPVGVSHSAVHHAGQRCPSLAGLGPTTGHNPTQRPTDHDLFVGASSEGRLLECIVYGEARANTDASDANQLGRVYKVYDGAGEATVERYDFKGNAAVQVRRLVHLPVDLLADPDATADWSSIREHETLDAMEPADNWTRSYDYAEGTCRLVATRIGSGAWSKYDHNLNGQMTAMPGQAVMGWNGKDELAYTSSGAGTAVQAYTYGADGQRMRK